MGSRWMMAIISLFIIFLGYGIGYASEEPEIYGQFEKVGPIILDTVTGLEWQVGPDQLTDWYEAEKWVDGLEGTWRMPSIAELQRLWDSGITCIAWGPFENSGMWIWSSQVRPPSYACSFNFLDGVETWPDRFNSNLTRAFAVRFPAETFR